MLFPIRLQSSHKGRDTFGRLVVVAALSAGLHALPAEAESGKYVPYSGIVHGTDGATPVDVVVGNETSGVLKCRVALAHWYSDDLGRIAPGTQLTLTLWHDPETGVLNLMNATDDRMPVETIWCSTNATRARLNLPIAAGKTEATLRFACSASDNEGLSCEATGG